ncbi:MAG: 50S ribosomal protein L15 [candidate division KSB1 bacterium]
MELSNLTYTSGSRKNRKRVGRGIGSGHGGTSTRGHKGLYSRSGSSQKAGFEGGQMPLQRRLPKRGFNNIFRVEYQIVNLDKLAKLEGVAVVNLEVLHQSRIIRKKNLPVKILGTGELAKAFEVHAHSFTKSAKEKIEKAGGKAVILGAAVKVVS